MPICMMDLQDWKTLRALLLIQRVGGRVQSSIGLIEMNTIMVLPWTMTVRMHLDGCIGVMCRYAQRPAIAKVSAICARGNNDRERERETETETERQRERGRHTHTQKKRTKKKKRKRWRQNGKPDSWGGECESMCVAMSQHQEMV